MGTSTSDVLYRGLCHAEPPKPADGRRRYFLSKRWKQWLPAITHHLTKVGKIHDLEFYHKRHSEALAYCYECGVPTSAILLHRFDNPFVSHEALRLAVEEFQLKQKRRKPNKEK